MTTAAYLRVSSEFQAKANGSDSQRHSINRWAVAKDIDPASIVWFEDSAVSGRSMDRAAWNEMMRRVRAEEFERVVMCDLSRAGRTLKGLLAWADEMRARKVPVVFLSENIDLGTPVGQLMFSVIGAVSEFLRKLTAEKISAGIRAKLAKGEKWGRGRSVKPTPNGAPRFTNEDYDRMRARIHAGEKFEAVRAEAGLSRQWLQRRMKRAAVL